MTKPFTAPRRFVGCLGVHVWIALAILHPLGASAASTTTRVQVVSDAIRQQIAAKPSDAPAILEANLRELPENERLRLASGAYAATLEGVEKNADPVLRLFEKGVTVVPRAVVGLMEVAHRGAPDRILEVTEIAIRQVTTLGMEDLVPAITAKAIGLAPGQRDALTRLAMSMTSPSLRQRILNMLGGAEGNDDPALNSALRGTINPANVGGNVVSPEQ